MLYSGQSIATFGMSSLCSFVLSTSYIALSMESLLDWSFALKLLNLSLEGFIDLRLSVALELVAFILTYLSY